jgi:hypothetical protein
MWVRLFARAHAHGGKPVSSVRMRVRCQDLPDGAQVKVADLQLQPGALVTGWTLHPSDLGVQSVTGWQFRNGVLAGDQTVIVTADVDSASPTMVDARGQATVQVGGFYFGQVDGWALLDGMSHTATQGAGIPPHLTAGSDIDIPTRVDGRVLASVWFRGHATSDPEPDPPPAGDDGTVTGAHPSWGAVLASHNTWVSLTDIHEEW